MCMIQEVIAHSDITFAVLGDPDAAIEVRHNQAYETCVYLLQ